MSADGNPEATGTTRRRARVTRIDPDAPTAEPTTVESSSEPSSNGAGSTESHSAELVPFPNTPGDDADSEPRRSDVDEWGRSEHMREIARRVYDPIYRHWFRADWRGLEKIPTDGGALLVANHAGAIPADAPVIMHGIETELERPVYGLADNIFRSVPVVGTLWSRLGGLPAHPDNAYRLLKHQKQLVLVFPEGTKGPAKTFTERYQLRRFGRGGFVEIAMRAGVPVVPIAVVGSEEAMPTLGHIPGLARVMGVPYAPVTANMLAFGPLGLAAYFPAKFTLQVLDPVHFDVPPDRERYSRSKVMEESEAIRDHIQSALYDLLRDRESVWFG
ncbi:MAG: lysophospholipid acyltransferase family protein [Microthrixaceae bacterium]